jgi:plasmid stabilization system protein ParE
MTRGILIRSAAEAEISAAIAWYEACSPGLGAEFLLALEAALHAAARQPQSFPVVHKIIRRALTRRFPYAVLFVEEPTQIVVLAVFHARRNPQHWQERT